MNLFLDDLRNPADVDLYLNTTPKFSEIEWTVVRNYDAFVSMIEEHGLPEIVALDRDLADSHYVPEEYWDNYEASKAYQEEAAKSYTEKTGEDCAKWLCEYCRKHDYDLPFYIVHSANPVGRDNIKHILEDYIGERLLNKKSLMENQ